MKKVALWAIPRAVGSAFERVFFEREDTTVAHELFMPCHYYSESRVNSRYDGIVEPAPENEYEYVKKSIGQLPERPILFLKEIAFHMKGIVEVDFWSGFTHTFIIRDPRVSIPSLHRLMPDASFEETGFLGIKEMFDMATEVYGQPPVVVNGDEFRRNPKETLRVYCELVGVPFHDTTEWTEGKVLPEWQRWEGWHDEVLTSSRVFAPPVREQAELPRHVEQMIEDALPYYLEINRHAISV
ncbi:hypothetical protein [Streptosporangium saharense]|uniref:sulfotransferase-like domain-containing protein n=1 Tax=Streptosporangium saharense TaxID=1706840 RepID=UPI00342DB599